ncbi:MAG: TIGR02996 domain-containing protein [Myxococcaceae bacterium]
MSVIPLDAFEGEAPPAVQSLLMQARGGTGELAWLNVEDQRRGSPIQALMRGSPPMPPEVVGWAIGICLFEDGCARYITGIMSMYAVRPPVPFALDAIGAGLNAGLVLPVDTWKRLDELFDFASVPGVPTLLARALAIGLTSSSSQTRGAALAIARRAPATVVPHLEQALGQKLVPSQKKRLEEALAALRPASAAPAPGAPGGQKLMRLLEAWAATFDPRLVPAITAVGTAESAGRPPLKAASKSELESAWHALAKQRDPLDVVRLLAVPFPGAWRAAKARIDALERFPADPRIADAVQLHAPRYTSAAGHAVQEAARFVAMKMQRLKKADAPSDVLDEVAKAAPVAADLTQLWKAVWERPTDDGRRAVLADALQAAGDPRGEFITLQLAIAEGRADARAEQRVRELLSHHVDTWSGSLPTVQRASREFRRGFLSAVSIRPEPKQLGPVRDRLEWRTIERIEVEQTWAGLVDEVLPLLANLPSLKTVLFHMGAWKLEDLAKAQAVSSTVTTLGTSTWLPTHKPAAFPALDTLGFSTAEPLEAMHAAARLGLPRALVQHGDVMGLRAAFEHPQVKELREVVWAPARGWSARLWRAAPREADVFSSGRYEKGSLAELAEALGRSRLTVHCPLATKPKIEADVKGLELSFDHRPVDVLVLPRKDKSS